MKKAENMLEIIQIYIKDFENENKEFRYKFYITKVINQ